MDLITKFRSTCFYVLVWAVTGVLFLPNCFGLTTFSFVQLAPGLAALLLHLLIQKHAGCRPGFSIVLFKMPQLKHLAYALAIPLVIALLSASAFWLFQLAFVVSLENVSVISIILMFVFCYAEEIGWRNYLLPLMLKKYSIVIASLIIGLLWGLWHLPVYLESSLPAFLLFMLRIISLSFILSWLYVVSEQNLLVVAAFHFANNLSVTVLPYDHSLFSSVFITIITLTFAIVVTARQFKKTSDNSTLSSNSEQ